MHAAARPDNHAATTMTATARPLHTRLAAALLLCASAAALPVMAQSFPTKPVRIIIPYPAGGSTDIQGRMIATATGERLKQPFLVENRPGGNATIGVAAVAKSAPDGYTISVMNLPAASLVFNKTLPYDTDKDFEPITGIYRTAYVIAIGTSLPAKTLKEFIDVAKANPGKYNYASHVATAQLTMEMLKSVSGMNIVPINYKGSAAALQALRVDEIQAMADLGGVFTPLVKDGKARVLAVTGDQRMAQLPDVPTMAELGYPAVRSALTVGMWGPAGIPAPIVKTLNAALVEAIKTPEISARIIADGPAPNPSTPEQLRERYKVEVGFWTDAAKVANFKPE
jgi:tripartite-type tricarboxylate transporter receptor subunit TctC